MRSILRLMYSASGHGQQSGSQFEQKISRLSAPLLRGQMLLVFCGMGLAFCDWCVSRPA